MARLNTPAARILLGLVVPVLLLIWWQAQSAQGGARALAFVPLQEVGATLAAQIVSGFLLNDVLSTLSRALTGLLLGGLAGTALGVAMAMWRPLDRVVGPLYHAVRQVPLLGWLPLIGLWVGNGDATKLLVVSLAAFYPTVLNSYEGVAAVERRYVEVGSLFGFSPAQRFSHVLLPAALPLILTGFTQALAFAWIATIGTEILLGAPAGLGATMGVAQAQQRMDVILVAILAAALLGFSINHLFARLRRHLLRWQPVLA
ncbi:ABC transporter permease subunit [Sphingomonas sp. MG17]|uniref:ABC transporter permease subunit n=1 Tax=Sphingomonas tagetis TaxID=2949092 RepID=A0A9X2HKZ0_9SPHN|nr:ABC transporter permease subunit [Sphingomonas tagetis]MCP3731099.1 ABC transporter permease subunit [Sphingomonas tagetis]